MSSNVGAPRSNLSVLRVVAQRLRRKNRAPQEFELDIAYLEASGKFDQEWYFARYPDVEESGMDAIRHYVLHGVSECRDPSDKFSTEFYLKSNPDVQASGLNPFRHFLEYGLKEGRKPMAEKTLEGGSAVLGAPGRPGDAKAIATSEMFDRDYYLRTYPDVARVGMDPVKHYVRYGASEGRNPRADFDTWFYLGDNPDVAQGSLNPFLHYIEHGMKEGRPGLAADKLPVIGGPLVSVIIPVYAVEQYLADCLKSVLNQTYKNIEIVIVDDGSPDRSYDIARAYAERDSRIRIIRRENGGLGAARNTGVSAAMGKYLSFVDSDDILPPAAIGRLVSSLQESGSDFAIGAIRRLKNGRLMPPAGWVKDVHAEDRLGVRLRDFPEILTDVFACNKLFDSEFFRHKVGEFPEKIRYEDQEPTARAFRRGVFDVLVDTVYHWRIREDGSSITQNKSDLADLDDRLVVKQRVEKILREEDQSTYETWLAKAIGFDLRSYFEQVPRTDQKFFDRLREGMKPLASQMSPRTWQKVRIVDRLPALAVLEGNRNDVIIAITRRAEYGFFVPGCLKGGVPYLARSYLEGMALSPSDDLLRLGNVDTAVKSAVTSLFWRDGKLHLEGYAYLTNLEFDDSFSISAKLVSDNCASVPLRVRSRQNIRIDQDSGDSWNAHANSGFSIQIDPVSIQLNPAAEWRLELSVGSVNLTTARSAILRDIDMRGVPNIPVLSAASDGSRWSGEFKAGAGFILRNIVLPGSLVTAIEVGVEEFTLTVDCPTAESILLVCESLRSIMKVPPVERFADRTVFRFKIPDISLADSREHHWHLSLFDHGAPQKLSWAGDVASLERESPGYRRVRAVMDQRGALHLVQYSWFAAADEVNVENDVIIIRGRVDAPSASGLSVRLVGETQELSPSQVTLDASHQRFVLRVPLDPAISRLESANIMNDEPGRVQPSLLHGFSVRLSVIVQGQSYERWLRVADDLQREFPTDFTASRYGVTFTRTNGAAALWVNFRPPYRDDERGRLAQRRLHSTFQRQRVSGGRAGGVLREAILFESFAGRQVADSVLGICNEIVRRRMDMDLYWTVADPAMPVPKGTKPLLIHSREWMDQLHNSRYLINNNNFPFYFRKRPGQIYLQTWHGTPLKRIGNHVPQANLSLPYRSLMLREAEYWDYLLVQNDYAAEVIPEAFGYTGEVINVGYPRNDTLVGVEAEARRLAVRNSMALQPYHFVVLYAPTWRDNLSGPKGYRRVENLDFQMIRELLGEGSKVIVRGHHNTAKSHGVKQPGIIDATHYPNINDLLLAADLMITDYSSIMFDYVVTGKPIVFLTPDLEQYRDKVRGFYFDLEDVAPGPICLSNGELFNVLSQMGAAVEAYSDRYSNFRERFSSRDDGGASARVVDAIWPQSYSS